MHRLVFRLLTLGCLVGICGGQALADPRSELPATRSSKAGPKTDPKAGSKAGSKAGQKADPKAGSKTDLEVGSKAGSKAASKAGQKADPKAGSKAGQKAGPKSAPRVQVEDDTLSRLAFLCERLDAGERNLRLWWGLWIGVHATMGVAQALVAGFSDSAFRDPLKARAFRNSLATGAITSGVGLVAVLASYPAGIGGCGQARRRRNSTPKGDEEALALAERQLMDTANGLRFGRSWLTHAGGVLLNVAAGLVLWLAFDQPIDAGIQLGAGIAVAEIQVWTQPTAAIRDYDAYLRRFPTLVPASFSMRAQMPEWRFVPYPGGLGVVVSY